MRRTLGVMLALALGGCGNEMMDATPQAEPLQLELAGGSSEGFAPSSSGVQSAALSGAGPTLLLEVRNGIAGLNEAVGDIVHPIEAAIATVGIAEQTGTTTTWKPFDHGNATLLFTMKKLGEKRFGWILQAKPQGADDSQYQGVMAGEIALGDQPHHGIGVMGADLDKYASVDSSYHGSGQLLVGFAHVAGYKALAYGLHNFSPDVTTFDPIDAVFSGWRGPLGTAHVRLALYDNFDGTPTAAKELLLMHARWLPLVGGRVDAIVTGGDVPAGNAYVANSCFDGNFDEGFLLMRDCMANSTAPATCTIVKTSGSPSACVHDLADEELPPSSPTDPSLEPGAPTQPSLPSSMPSP